MTGPIRTPSQNNPLAPPYLRPERKTRPTYADPTGGRATGRARSEDKFGELARARAARRALLEEKTR